MRPIYIYYFAIALMASACSSSKPIKKVVSQKYYNLTFSPDAITKKSVNNTEITVTPVDAKSLNKETYDAAFRDGNYEKEFISVIESWKSKLTSLPKRQKRLLQGKINAFDFLTKLEKDGKIPSNLSIHLRRRIISESNGKNGSEVESLVDIEIIPADYNPYKVNANYFSVFKLIFENTGNVIEKINIKEFQLVSNEEQLYPLASEYFETNLKDHSETIKNSYRMNMPNELIITPGQRVSKYIAVPAINTQNNKLQVQFIRNSNVVNFDFDVLKKESERNFNLEKYEFKSAGDGDDISYEMYYVISFKENMSYALLENNLFVNDVKKSFPVSVYALGISPSTSELVFGSAKKFYIFRRKT